MRAFTKSDSLAALDSWVTRSLNGAPNKSLHEIRSTLKNTWDDVKQFVKSLSNEEAIARGRDISFSIAFVVMGTLLVLDAERDSDPLAIEVALRWVLEGMGRETFQIVGGSGIQAVKRNLGFKDRAEIDCRIVYGHGLQTEARL